MSIGYEIYDRSGSYFLTFQVVDWVNIFTPKIYRDIVLESLDRNRCSRYMMDVELRIQIKNLASHGRRRSPCLMRECITYTKITFSKLTSCVPFVFSNIMAFSR